MDKAREAAVFALERTRRDGAWTSALSDAMKTKYDLDSRSLSLAVSISLGVLQNTALLDYYIDLNSKSASKIEPKVRDIMRSGAYQLIFMGKIPASAAVNEHHVWFFLFEDDLELQQHVARHVEERLPGLHDCQIMVGHNIKDAKHLVEHLAMLPRYGHDSLKLSGPRLQLVHERAHLDGLRASPEDKHYLLQTCFSLSLCKFRACRRSRRRRTRCAGR